MGMFTDKRKENPAQFEQTKKVLAEFGWDLVYKEKDEIIYGIDKSTKKLIVKYDKYDYILYFDKKTFKQQKESQMFESFNEFTTINENIDLDMVLVDMRERGIDVQVENPAPKIYKDQKNKPLESGEKYALYGNLKRLVTPFWDADDNILLVDINKKGSNFGWQEFGQTEYKEVFKDEEDLPLKIK